jgi:hypothetical protein
MRRRAIRAGRVSINPDWNAGLLNIWKTDRMLHQRDLQKRIDLRNGLKNNTIN